MYSPPFVRLATPRVVDRPDLLPDLAEFYARHEGNTDGSDPEWSVKLHRLDEISQITWDELDRGRTPPGWEEFAALRIGSGIYFQQIVYVLAAPCCPAGSILAVDPDICGPGGTGPDTLESTLVLALNFSDWLIHLERWGWAEPAICSARDYTGEETQQIRQYYLALNPTMHLGGGQYGDG